MSFIYARCVGQHSRTWHAEGYNKKPSTYDFCRRLMTLPFLPTAYILSVFATIEATDLPEPLSQLRTCFKRQWMTNSIFSISSQSFLAANSDKQRCRRMAQEAEKWRQQPTVSNLYKFIQVLYTEATYVSTYKYNSFPVVGRLRGLAVACWTTDHYHPCSNPGVGISEGCFVFHFVSLPFEVARPI